MQVLESDKTGQRVHWANTKEEHARKPDIYSARHRTTKTEDITRVLLQEQEDEHREDTAPVRALGDCMVAEWSLWSACSRSCGSGYKVPRPTP